MTTNAPFAHPPTSSRTGVPPKPAGAWSVLDLLEPLLLLGAGAAVFQVEQLAPARIGFVLALLLIPYLLRWIFDGAPSATTLALVPLALLFLVLIPLTIWVTPDFWTFTWPELARMIWGGAVFLGVLNWALPHAGRRLPAAAMRPGQLPVRLAWLTAAYLGLGVGLAGLGLLNMALVSKIPLVDTVAATLLQLDLRQLPGDESFNPNRVAALLILVAPLPLAWLIAWPATSTPVPALSANPWAKFLQDLLTLSGRLLAKAGWLLLWLGFTGALLLTQSRTALLATLVATLVILLLTLRQPAGGLRFLGVICFFGLVVGMGYFTLRLLFGDLLATAAATYDQTARQFVNTQSLSGRLLIWERALYGIADFPLTGYGLGVFAQIAEQPYPPLPDYRPGAFNHAHNLFLQTALDLGLPGLITFATLVGLAGVGLIRCYRAAPPHSAQATWALGMLGTFVGFVIYNLFDGLTLGARPAVAMWFFLGLAIAAGQRQALVDAWPTRN